MLLQRSQDVEFGVWSTVFGIFRNAWVKAFNGNTDNSIKFRDAFQAFLKKRKT